jgi:hypothetical protein
MIIIIKLIKKKTTKKIESFLVATWTSPIYYNNQVTCMIFLTKKTLALDTCVFFLQGLLIMVDLVSGIFI